MKVAFTAFRGGGAVGGLAVAGATSADFFLAHAFRVARDDQHGLSNAECPGDRLYAELPQLRSEMAQALKSV